MAISSSGQYITAVVSNDGIYTCVNSLNIGPQNTITGPTGPTGFTGPTGQQSTVAGPTGPTGPGNSSITSQYWTPTGATGITYYPVTISPTGPGPTGPNMSVSGNLYVTGVCQAASFNATSDYRIKETPISLDEKFIVDYLKPVIYKNTITNKIDIGLIAHELEEIYPFLVNGEKDGEENQSVNYIGIIGILIKEIQQLKKDVKALKSIHL
jgi:hypothetical protein